MLSHSGPRGTRCGHDGWVLAVKPQGMRLALEESHVEVGVYATPMIDADDDGGGLQRRLSRWLSQLSDHTVMVERM